MSAYRVLPLVWTRFLPAMIMAFVLSFGAVPQASAQVTDFRQAVAQAAANDPDLIAFYRERNFDGIWSTSADRNRRNALLVAFNSAADHGLPADRYDANGLIARLQAATTPQEQGRLEVEVSRQFLDYARDLQTGILTPARIDPAIH
ncbi:MAG: murein L,D-transpeptidase, partial [Paracoccaceae bacterium]|nr:murein L,D-transpeptidase [Paracoccaceae bacterium]